MVTPSPSVKLDPAALLARVWQLESQLKVSEARCARAEYKLQDLLRRIYGPKSEKIGPTQRVLFACLKPQREHWRGPLRRAARRAPNRRSAVAGEECRKIYLYSVK